jgi:alpha-L-rhamnosidase
VLGDLKHAGASVKTVRGIISSSWKRTGDSLALDVTIPVNAEAKVSVPTIGLKNVTITEAGKVIWKGGRFVKGVSGITAGSGTEDYITFDVGSGTYSFLVLQR